MKCERCGHEVGSDWRSAANDACACYCHAVRFVVSPPARLCPTAAENAAAEAMLDKFGWAPCETSLAKPR